MKSPEIVSSKSSSRVTSQTTGAQPELAQADFGGLSLSAPKEYAAPPETPPVTPNNVLYLQRAIGNRATASWLGKRSPQATAMARPLVQRKLTVGPANDRYEEEAEQIANRVQRAATPPIQREGGVGPAGGELTDDVARTISRSQSGGSAMPKGVRSKLEPKLGADLGNVKVHTDSHSAQLNRQLNAKAFTHKNHIFYGAGQSPSDLKLTAHETVHTIQQGAVQQNNVQPMRDKTRIHRMSIASIKPSPTHSAKSGVTIQRNFLKNLLKGGATTVSGIAGAAGGAIIGGGGGTLAGLIGGAGVGATKTWKALTKDKSNWHKLYAWLPTLLAGVAGGVAGTVAGATVGTIGGAIGGAHGLGGRVSDELWSSTEGDLGPIPEKPLLDPGLPGKFLGTGVIVDPQQETIATAERGDRCLVYEIGSSPWVKVALGEKGDGVQGFVDKRRVISSWSGRDTPWFEGRATHKSVVDDPLFIGTPSEKDIVQGSIGDCYLLAALSNVARVDPDYIQSKLIKDNNDGTATARFYRRGDNGKSTPESVTVRKSLLKYNRSLSLMGKVTNQKKPLWPGMVEKAYATWRGSKSLPEMENTPGNYQKLEGGWGDEVFRALYGGEAQQEELSEGSSNLQAGFVYPWSIHKGDRSDEALAFKNAIKAILIRRSGKSEDDPAKAISKRAMDDYGLWRTYANKNAMEIAQSLNSLEGGYNPNVPFVIRHLNAAGIRGGEFFDAVVEYCRQFLGGEGNKGIYTPAALTAYGKIKSLTDRHQHITIGTRAFGKDGKVLTGSGRIKTTWVSGVLSVDDLFPSHAYEVVGTMEKNGVRFIKLRNPHGSKKMIGSAEFYIELSRAMRYLDSFHYMDRDGQEKEDEEVSQEVQEQESEGEQV